MMETWSDNRSLLPPFLPGLPLHPVRFKSRIWKLHSPLVNKNVLMQLISAILLTPEREREVKATGFEEEKTKSDGARSILWEATNPFLPLATQPGLVYFFPLNSTIVIGSFDLNELCKHTTGCNFTWHAHRHNTVASFYQCRHSPFSCFHIGFDNLCVDLILTKLLKPSHFPRVSARELLFSMYQHQFLHSDLSFSLGGRVMQAQVKPQRATCVGFNIGSSVTLCRTVYHP